jgi:hypothetical protein
MAGLLTDRGSGYGDGLPRTMEPTDDELDAIENGEDEETYLDADEYAMHLREMYYWERDEDMFSGRGER